MSVTSADAEVINSMKLSNDEIFRAMGVPPPLLGALEHATLSNVEQMVSAWLSFSLGGLIERYERALDRLFNLNSNDDRIEMDVTILLRSDLSARMDAYSKMVNSGVATPNEIRRKEGLASVDGGDSIFLQRQMTPVDLITQLNVAELEEARREPAPVVAPAVPEVSQIDEDIARMVAIDAIKKAMQ
jgi:phage portal protein BeeE